MSQWEQMTKTQLINELEARGIWLERLGAIVDGSWDAVFISDEDSQFMLVNAAACDLTGYSEAELLEMKVPDLHEDEDGQAFESRHRPIMEGRKTLTEAFILRKDGSKVLSEFSTRWIEIAGTPFMHTIARDITERRRTEEQLRLMSVVAYQVSDGIVATDLDFKITFVNQAFEDLYGYTAAEVMGKTPHMLNADPNSAQVIEEIYQTVSSGREWKREVLNVRRDGSTFPSELSVVPLFDENGVIFAYVGSQRDITERKRIEEELRLMSVITLQVSDAVIATDLDFRIMFLNEAFKSLFGYSEDEVLGRTPDFLNAEELRDEVQKEIYEKVSNGEEWRGVALNRKKDGTTFPCELIAVPLVDEDGQVFGYAGTQRDVSGRKRASEEREATIERVRSTR
jgi:PAS domain S-box-containing protein